MRNTLEIALLVMILLTGRNLALGQDFSYKGEATIMLSKVEDQEQTDWLLRYLPELKVAGEEGKHLIWDANVAAYLYAYESQLQEKEQGGEVFRAWFRVYDDSTEYRLGLQELSFGPAVLLRTLQWFDTKDALDPTSFTKGVKGALIRISTENNSSYWIWSLYGNEDLYSATRFASDTEKPEFGGRSQFSGDLAEWAITLHQRDVLLNKQESVKENRLGLDLKLDLEYNGLWLESMLIKRDAPYPYPSEARQSTAGIDYTLDFSDGIVLTLERNWGDAKTEATEFAASQDNTAFMASIGQRLLDSFSLTLMQTKIPETSVARFDWQRTYDDYIWDLSLFKSKQGTAPGQYGLGLIVQYNH